MLRPEQLNLPVDECVQKETDLVCNQPGDFSASAQHLCKTYNSQGKSFTALEDLTIGAKRGEVLGLLGPNGAGKSTAFNILSMGLERSSGTVELLNQDIGSHKVGSQLGMCPQDNVIWEHLTVKEHFQLVCGIKGLSADQEKEQTQ